MESDEEGSRNLSQVNIKIIYQLEEEVSSIDIPPEEWSSLLLAQEETNAKKFLAAEGLYKPGSGEICAKYVALSASSVQRHPYYKYPAIKDPGIEDALLGPPPKITYSDDGQELYLTLCQEMLIAPIRYFYTSLLTSKVDLSYYGISTKGFRAISLALQYNRLVKVLNLTGNWMNTDACYHLGHMLRDNNTIEELTLKGCRIGAAGAEVLFYHLAFNRNITKLDLSRNQLGDKGIEFSSNGIFKNPLIVNINLSRNEITAEGVITLAELLERRNKLTHLDLSWNTVVAPTPVYKLCQQLMENNYLVELDLSWNSLKAPKIGTAIKMVLMNAESIKKINLSNNKLSGLGIKYLGRGLPDAKNLETLNLSFNPLTPQDALLLLQYLLDPKVKLKHLLMDEVIVEQTFVETRKEILSLDYRKNTTVTHGYVRPTLVIRPTDMKYLILKRTEAMGRLAKNKKNRVDFPMLILEMHAANPEPIIVNYFARALKLKGLVIGDDLTEGFAQYFAGPKDPKDKNQSKTVSLDAIVDYIRRLWPDKKLPPPPPPVEIPPPTKHKKKGKAKKRRGLN